MAVDLPNLVSSLYPRHPARAVGFDELYAGLQCAVREHTVYVTRDADEGLELYAYTNACVFDKRWDLFSLISRGLIVDPASRRVVATPFPKFFNYGEAVRGLPAEPFEVTEKIDGSMGIVFHHGRGWRVATRGAFDSDQARWATRFLRDNVTTSRLLPGTTYLVEIVYRRNRIVVDYPFEGLVLLSAYDEDGNELVRAQLEHVAREVGMRITAVRPFDSVPDLLAVAAELAGGEEGFVVRFAGGLRVKIKGSEYCRIHRCLSHCTPLALWEAMMNGDDLDAMRRDMTEEMLGDFDALRSRITARLEALVADVNAAGELTRHLPDQQVGPLVADEKSALSAAARKFLFVWRRGTFLNALSRPGQTRQTAFRLIRPDGNQLPGYTPSKATSRFQSEQE
jgi:RNA ligase